MLKSGHQQYNPTGRLQQNLLGNEPITSYQDRQTGLQKAIQGSPVSKNASLEDKVKAGLRQKLAIPLSVAGTAVNAGTDASVVGGVTKVGAKAGVKGFKALDEAAIMAAQRNPAAQIGGVGKNVNKALPSSAGKSPKSPSPLVTCL
jgi:hypothetical protein